MVKRKSRGGGAGWYPTGLLRFQGSGPRGAPGGRVRRVLERVVERHEVVGAAPQRGGRQPVREPAVLGQQGAVQIGSDDRALRAAANALRAGAPVVSMTSEDASERALGRAQARAAAMVLKAG